MHRRLQKPMTKPSDRSIRFKLAYRKNNSDSGLHLSAFEHNVLVGTRHRYDASMIFAEPGQLEESRLGAVTKIR